MSGIRAIVGTSYFPRGDGRDWFWMGDFEYRNGKKTPTGRAEQEELTALRKNRLSLPRSGPPAEIGLARAHMSMRKCKKEPVAARTMALWKTKHEEPLSVTAECTHIWKMQQSAPRQPRTPGICRLAHWPDPLDPSGQASLPFAAASTEHGRYQSFDSSSEMSKDKYRSFSEPILHPARFSFLSSELGQGH